MWRRRRCVVVIGCRMACYHPVPARREDSGRVVIWPQLGTADMSVPCGGCIGCRLERSQMWSLRARHEASCWDHNVFLTLTYDEERLPPFGFLNPKHPRKFIKALRDALYRSKYSPNSAGNPIRYFGCGEYGSQRRRPHYHLLLFNLLLTDRERYGQSTYTSRLVSDLWQYGSHLCGDVTPESCAYTAGYATKKLTDPLPSYVVDTTTGEVFDRPKEFPMMSLKPAIGQAWYDKYKSELRHGYCVVDGAKLSVPRLYRKKLAAEDPAAFEEMSWNQWRQELLRDPADRSEARLAVREEVAYSRKSFFSTSHLED